MPRQSGRQPAILGNGHCLNERAVESGVIIAVGQEGRRGRADAPRSGVVHAGVRGGGIERPSSALPDDGKEGAGERCQPLDDLPINVASLFRLKARG